MCPRKGGCDGRGVKIDVDDEAVSNAVGDVMVGSRRMVMVAVTLVVGRRVVVAVEVMVKC